MVAKLSLTPASPRRKVRASASALDRGRGPRIGLALAGGGPLGAIYEVGALCALEESVKGLDLTDCQGYIGVSAGGFLAAGLVNGVSPRELCAAFIENTGEAVDVFEPSVLMHPAWGEYAQRLSRLPGLLAEAAWDLAIDRRSLSGVLERLGPVLPTGLFSNDALEQQLRRQFTQPGRSNDFRRLRHKLVLVATQLDSGQAAAFGQPGWDHVPISRAVQASAALPGLFPPVEIDGQHYVDGALKKTVHASLLLDEGLDLLICLNPLVPFDARIAMPQPDGDLQRIPRLIDGGLPLVLSQTFRSLIHSRLELGLRGYEHSYPDTDILLFEPDHRDPEMFMANTFSYSQRRRLAEHAYQQTRAMLRADQDGITAKLQGHGLHIDTAALKDKDRVLVNPLPLQSRSGRAVRRLEGVLDELEQVLGRAGAPPPSSR